MLLNSFIKSLSGMYLKNKSVKDLKIWKCWGMEFNRLNFIFNEGEATIDVVANDKA